MFHVEQLKGVLALRRAGSEVPLDRKTLESR